MAKDKEKKDSSNAAESKPPTPIARGHRQRGAGTVIVAKAAVVTNDGVTLKPHERLPSVLLNEYCQKEKRPKPKYSRNSSSSSSSGIRMTALLEDAKNSKNDLVFTPVQGFESETIARDFAALLALFHFQKNIPLERKLPEPFATTWLEMLNAASPSASSTTAKPGATLGKTAPAAAPVAVVTPPVAPVVSVVPQHTNKSSGSKSKASINDNADSASSEWLCDNCGVQNFNTTATGIVRTKCFKCQSPKPEKSIIVTKSQNSKRFKTPPKAVFDLRAQNTFASRAELDRNALEDRAAKNRRLTYFDALKRANRPKPIHLKPGIREQLESIFGLEHLSVTFSTIRGLMEYIDDVIEEGIIPVDICSFSYLEQAEVLQIACQHLSDKGCSDQSIVHAVRNAIFKRNEELIEDFVVRYEGFEASNTSVSEKSRSVLQSLLADVLDSSVYAKLSLVSQTPSASSKISTSLDIGYAESVVQELESLGWRQDSVLLSALQFSKAFPLVNQLQGEALEFYLPLLVHSLSLVVGCNHKSSMVTFFHTIGNGSVAEHNNTTLEEEREAMSAILGDKFCCKTSTVGEKNFTILSITNICLQEKLKFQHSVDLIFVFHDQLVYPDHSPLILIKNSVPNDKRSDSRLMALNVFAQDSAAMLQGSCLMYELYSLLLDFSDCDELFRILNTIRLSDEIVETYMTLTEDKSGLASDEDINQRMIASITQQQSTTAQDNDSDSDLTELESTSTDAKLALPNKNSKLRTHPFWSKSRGKDCVGVDINNVQYKEMMAGREKLPSYSMKSELLSILPSNRAIIVTGETGCGKTTQIPQFIHEEQRDAKILICQPRRLAAIGVASRVAEEQACVIGDRVGYMVKGDSKVSNNTRIMFCTYGVLLRRLQQDPTIGAIDYVVFDEIHERGIDSDFCLALMMEALEARSSLKLILMSATISTDHFRSYVKKELKMFSLPPLLHIPGFTYPVKEIYKGEFEEAVRAYQLSVPSNSGGNNNNDSDDHPYYSNNNSNTIGGRGNVNKRKDVDYDLLVKLVFCLIKGTDIGSDTFCRAAQGCILIFLPGVPEINRFLDYFRQYWIADQDSPKLNLIALHGNVAPQEQSKVFKLAPKGTIKIVAATNVAEASVTIPDVTVVVDTCRVKEMGYDPETQAHGLSLKFAAKDSLRQRRGRAGRVQEGRCFRMITAGTFEKLPSHSVPEILRLPLESVLLQVWAMNSLRNAPDLSQACLELLNRCPDAPSQTAITTAQEILTGLQAIDRETNKLTSLGWHLSHLPCTPRVGRLLVYGCLLSCVFPVACVAATMTLRSPFITTLDSDTAAKVQAAKEKYSSGSLTSDYNVIVKAMIDFQSCGDQRRFCKQHGLAFERMLEIKQSMREFMEDLVDIGLLSSVKCGLDVNHPVVNANANRINLLAATYCAGLYPQVAKIIRPPKRFMEVMGSAVERDAVAKEMKIYVQKVGELDGKVIAFPQHANADYDISTDDLQRVFIHSSSVNFRNNSFKASNYILFGEKQVMVQASDAKGDGTKIYLRDTSEVTAYSLLFFGGDLQYNSDAGVIVVDNWISFACSERISDLVKQIRLEFDRLLASKIENPNIDLSTNTLLVVVCELLDSSEEENR